MNQDTAVTPERYTAFTTDPGGGNPAGVVLDAAGLDPEAMRAVAADLGYSETAFVTARDTARRRYTVRYFSPLAEVDFCGHATIATAVALAEESGPGAITLDTGAGEIPVLTGTDPDGFLRATLTSAATRSRPARDTEVDEALTALGWGRGDLDPSLPPHAAYGGVHHLVLAAAARERLADLSYDFDGLADVMLRHGWTTLQLVVRENPALFHARDPFPVGGVVEDAATGAAAAALGGYLRTLGLVPESGTVTVRQGEDMGRPSTLTVDIDRDDPRVRVSGHAVRLPA